MCNISDKNVFISMTREYKGMAILAAVNKKLLFPV